MRVELSQELVGGGYTPGTHGFDRAVHAELAPLEAGVCPFANLPEPSAGRWGQDLTAAKMKNCIWLRPEDFAQFRFLEWTPNDHLRHANFVALRDDKDLRAVIKEDETKTERKAPQGEWVDGKRQEA